MTRNLVKLTTYLESDIFVDDETGKFCAWLSNGRLAEERTLPAIKKAIEADEPIARVLRIAGERVDAHEDTITRNHANGLLQSSHANVTGEIFGYMEMDAGILERIATLERQQGDEQQALWEKYDVLKREVINTGIPLTASRLTQLLDEDRERKAARR